MLKSQRYVQLVVQTVWKTAKKNLSKCTRLAREWQFFKLDSAEIGHHVIARWLRKLGPCRINWNQDFCYGYDYIHVLQIFCSLHPDLWANEKIVIVSSLMELSNHSCILKIIVKKKTKLFKIVISNLKNHALGVFLPWQNIIFRFSNTLTVI